MSDDRRRGGRSRLAIRRAATVREWGDRCGAGLARRTFGWLIVVANQKGGSGRSITTVHSTVAAEKAGDGPLRTKSSIPLNWEAQRESA